MNRLGRIDIFLEVAKHSSFAKAAKILGITGPAASKQVMALEEELGIKLLHRTTRLVTLTDEGTVYYERARLAIEELKEAAEQVQDMRSTPKGVLKVSVPNSFGRMHLLETFSSFAARYPEVQMDISLDDRKVDIVAEGFDLAIRIGVTEDSSLIVHKLGMCPIHLVASPAYLENYGTPQTPEALKSHRFITYTLRKQENEWQYKAPDGKIGNIKFESVMRTNITDMLRQAAIDGIGIVQLPIFAISAHLKAGQLVRVLPEYSTYPVLPISVLMPPNRFRAAKVRLLVEWLSQACKTITLE